MKYLPSVHKYAFSFVTTAVPAEPVVQPEVQVQAEAEAEAADQEADHTK